MEIYGYRGDHMLAILLAEHRGNGWNKGCKTSEQIGNAALEDAFARF